MGSETPPGKHTWKSSLRDSISTCAPRWLESSLKDSIFKVVSLVTSHQSGPGHFPISLLAGLSSLSGVGLSKFQTFSLSHMLSEQLTKWTIFSLSHASLWTLSHTFLSATLIVLSAILIVLSQQLSYFSHRTSYYS